MLKERLPFEHAIEKKGEASSFADLSMEDPVNLVPIIEKFTNYQVDVAHWFQVVLHFFRNSPSKEAYGRWEIHRWSLPQIGRSVLSG